jgi:hypothetical protein
MDSFFAERALSDLMGLEEFIRLRHLDVEAELLPPTKDALPPNLEALVLRHCDVVDIYECFGLMYDLSEEEFTSLRTVHLEGHWEDGSEVQQVDAAVFDCTGKGVERPSGCCFRSSTPGFEIVIRNTARHTDTSDDWRCS